MSTGLDGNASTENCADAEPNQIPAIMHAHMHMHKRRARAHVHTRFARARTHARRCRQSAAAWATCVMPRVALARRAVVQPVADRPYLQRLFSAVQRSASLTTHKHPLARRHDEPAQTRKQRMHTPGRTHESTLTAGCSKARKHLRTRTHKRARVTLQSLPYSLHYRLDCGRHSTGLALSTGRALYTHLYYSNHHYRRR